MIDFKTFDDGFRKEIRNRLGNAADKIPEDVLIGAALGAYKDLLAQEEFINAAASAAADSIVDTLASLPKAKEDPATDLADRPQG
jgi:hypothetical protein